MEKKITHDEVDLLDFILIILQNKWKIILITSLAIIIMYLSHIFQQPIQNKFKASTEIRPISTFEESEYSTFNLYLKKITTYDVTDNIPEPDEKTLTVKDTLEEKNKIDLNKTLRNIDRIYLGELFLEKLNEREFLLKSIKEFNFIKKEKYENIEAYEEAISKLSNLIKLSSKVSKKDQTLGWKINFQTADKKKMGEFFNLS